MILRRNTSLTPNQPSQSHVSSKTHKFLVIGDPQCGKSSILDYFCKEMEASQKPTQTIGCDIHIKEIPSQSSPNSYDYLEFWDFAGETIHDEISKAYLQALEKDIDNLKGIIFCFDSSNIKTLFHINRYLEEIVLELFLHKNLSIDDLKIPLLIVGNRQDLLDEHEKADKIKVIKENLSTIFDDNEKANCIFLSNKAPISQFKEFDSFIQSCIHGETSHLLAYGPNQELYPPDRFSNYTKKKLNYISKEIKIARNYLFLKMLHYSTFITALMITCKKDEATK